MKLFPAIDLRGGRVVRLTEGDYNRMTVYGDDPVAVAKGFREAGATCLHVVDLDGAKDGTQENFPVIRRLIEESGLFVEVGGGGRDEASVDRYMDLGLNRMILGTAAIEQPALLEKLAAKYPGRIAAGVDARDGFVAIHGWKVITDIKAEAFLADLPARGVNTAIYTDISRDGMLQGTNLEAYRRVKDIAGLQIVASGGISFPEELTALQEMGIYGAIVGKALYDGKLPLEEALKRCGESL